MSGLLSMLKSRKFWTAIAGVVAVILVNLVGLDETTAKAISTAIVTLGGLYIVATGIEGQKKTPAGGTTPQPTVTPEDETVDQP